LPLRSLSSGAPHCVWVHLRGRSTSRHAEVANADPQLVRVGNNNHDLDIIPTFASGTLLVSQRYQTGRDDNPLFLAPSTATPQTPKPKKAAPAAEESTIPLNQATTGELKTSAKKQQYKPAPTASKDKITPLAVLNLYETAWLGEKYGVWDKQKYAADWFKTLNWTKVIERGTK
jgi:Fe-Mn family superoxide dismutase